MCVCADVHMHVYLCLCVWTNSSRINWSFVLLILWVCHLQVPDEVTTDYNPDRNMTHTHHIKKTWKITENATGGSEFWIESRCNCREIKNNVQHPAVSYHCSLHSSNQEAGGLSSRPHVETVQSQVPFSCKPLAFIGTQDPGKNSTLNRIMLFQSD